LSRFAEKTFITGSLARDEPQLQDGSAADDLLLGCEEFWRRRLGQGKTLPAGSEEAARR